MNDLYKDEMLYESELVKNPNFILQSLRDMSCLDLNFTSQIARNRFEAEDEAEKRGIGRVNKIVKNKHNLAFPSVGNARFHYDTDDSLYEL